MAEGTALAERIADQRAGVGDPRALLGELRRVLVLVPLDGGGLWTAESGGVRWVCGFADEAALARFAQARNSLDDAGGTGRRCLAYVAACLHRAQEDFGDTAMKSYISFSFADTDEAPLTSNITFCTPLPDVRPYIPDLESVKGAAVAELSAEDCSSWS